MHNNDEISNDLLYALKSLEHIALRLRFYAQTLVTTTLINLVITMMLMSGIYRMFHTETYGLIISLSPIICGVFAVIIAFRFDALKRDGDAYFEELSDELHGKKIKESNESYENERSLKARVIIRKYANAASVPLIPGKYGPVIIALMNIIFSFIGAILSSRFY